MRLIFFIITPFWILSSTCFAFQDLYSSKDKLVKADSIFNARNYQLAQEVYHGSYKEFLLKGDTLNALISRVNEAKSLFFYGDFLLSLKIGKEVSRETDLLEEIKSEEYIRLLRDLGIVFLSLREELILSEKYLSKAAEMLISTGLGSPKVRLTNFSNLAGAQYYLNKFSASEANYRKALYIAQQDSTLSASHQRQVLLGLSINLADQGKYNEAIKNFELLKKSYENEDNIIAQTWVLNSMARIYKYQGFYNKTIEVAKECIRLFTQEGLTEDPRIIEAQSLIGNSLIELGHFKEALVYHEKIYELEKDILGENHPNHIYTFTSLGRSYASLNIDSSLFYHDKAKELIQLHYMGNNEFLANNYDNLGKTFAESGYLDKALINYQKAFDIRNQLLGKNHLKTLNSQYSLAHSLFLLNKYKEAWVVLDDLIKNSLITPSALSISLKYVDADLFVNALGLQSRIGYLLLTRKEAPKLKEVYQRFKQYDSLTNQLRKESAYELDKSNLWMNYRENIDSFFPLVFDINQNEGESTELFSIVDNFKYLSLSEKFRKHKIKNHVSDSLFDLDRSLKIKLSVLKSELLSIPLNSPNQKNIESEIFSISEKLNKLTSLEIQDEYNNELIHSRLEPTLKDTDVISYFITKGYLYILFYTSKYKLVKEVKLDEFFDMRLNDLINCQSNPNQVDIQKFKELSSYFYQTLIDPINDLITSQHLTIIPDKKLNLLPFEVLLTSEAHEINSYKDLPYLIRQYDISYAPSLKSLIQLANKNEKEIYGEPMTIVPVFEKEGIDALIPDAGLDSRKGYNQLFWARNEANNVIDIIGGKLITDVMASEKLIKTNLQNPLILHFATHAVMNESESEFSFLALKGTDSLAIEDNKLYSFEIYNSDIQSELVTLSACNSGNGILRTGEGVLSLANSFFHAGAKSVVYSLWLANDQSTSTVISDFYNSMSQGNTKSVSLRNAKLNYLDNTNEITAHPFYWAHLVVSGSNEEIEIKKNGTMKAKLISLIIVLSIIFLFMRKFRQDYIKSRHKSDD